MVQPPHLTYNCIVILPRLLKLATPLGPNTGKATIDALLVPNDAAASSDDVGTLGTVLAGLREGGDKNAKASTADTALAGQLVNKIFITLTVSDVHGAEVAVVVPIDAAAGKQATTIRRRERHQRRQLQREKQRRKLEFAMNRDVFRELLEDVDDDTAVALSTTYGAALLSADNNQNGELSLQLAGGIAQSLNGHQRSIRNKARLSRNSSTGIIATIPVVPSLRGEASLRGILAKSLSAARTSLQPEKDALVQQAAVLQVVTGADSNGNVEDGGKTEAVETEVAALGAGLGGGGVLWENPSEFVPGVTVLETSVVDLAW